jgi:hypothetical protein
MEPRGCNLWQPVANGPRPKTAVSSETVAADCDQLRRQAHGKEGSKAARVRGMSRVMTSKTWYRNWYRSQRAAPHLEGLKRGQNPASVLGWTLRNRPSKPVRRRNPSVGRFDSCAAPLILESAVFVAGGDGRRAGTHGD